MFPSFALFSFLSVDFTYCWPNDFVYSAILFLGLQYVWEVFRGPLFEEEEVFYAKRFS